ncbi:GGDEF domain-containing protein [Sulfurimonas sp.]|uniref:GGDEF domain-containing protein n=1 Tax=Sulfurimonas sp. TaxID=2022749 RepID=UPI00260F40C6|nr:GGDEF domain-containing protein [Sulfurimonas sp.]MDD5157088.1 GGDEF domain-containing protein [Sulfurimonas sp.]
MKYSIKSIFNNLINYLILVTIFIGISVFMLIDYDNSYAKINTLFSQKEIVNSIDKLSLDDIELSLIKLSGQGAQLQDNTKKLRNLYEYNFAEKYIIMNSHVYLADLDKLDSLVVAFNKKANDYYSISSINKKENEEKKIELQISKNSLLSHIDLLLLRASAYDKLKFDIHKDISFAEFIIVLLVTFWYRKKLKLVYKDLEYLYNTEQKGYIVSTKEADSIAMRMKRKPISSENPAMIDPLTGINNLRGLMNSYSEKKGMKDNSYTSVTVFEIDNFSENNKKYPQEFIDGVLKKIAFSLSLNEQATDVIGRTDSEQFTVILSRKNKEESFRDMDIIRKSISELNFNGEVKITISGGYIIKPNNTNLEEAIKQAKAIMLYAQKAGGDRISQIRDVAHSEL